MPAPDIPTSRSEASQQCVHHGEDSIIRTVEIGEEKYSSTIETPLVEKNPTKAKLKFPDELLALPEWWWAVLNGARPEANEERGTLRVAEVFCGPGGLAQGVRQFCREAGWEFESVAAADLDADAVDVYNRNHSPDERFTHKGRVSELVAYDTDVAFERTDKKDHKGNPVKRITKATWKTGLDPKLRPGTWSGLRNEKQIDLLLAGPPCEGHSNLNNHTRRDDKRNADYLDVPALAVALDIPMVIIENVPAARHDLERVVDVARNLLENSGYSVREGVLKASKMGWPQTRSRFFMVARKKELGPPVSLEEVEKALYLDPDQGKPLPVRWATDQLEDVKTYEKFSDKLGGGLDRLSTSKDRPDPNDPEQIDTKFRLNWFEENEGELNLPLEYHNMSHRPGFKRKDGSVVKEEDVTYTSVYGRMNPEEPAPTLTTGFVTPGRGRFIHPTKARMLTPREAARLQGFPDNYDFALPSESPYEPAKPPSTKLLTKWIGDAVPMPLGYAAALWVLTRESSD